MRAAVGSRSGRWRGLYGVRRSGALLFMAFIVFWTIEAIAKGSWPKYATWEPLVCLIYFTAFCRFVFWGVPFSGEAPLMNLRDLVQNFPRRGILLLIPVAGLVMVVGFFNLDVRLSGVYQALLPVNASPVSVMLITVGAGIDFGILGKAEKDSGHEVRRFGEEMLFQDLKDQNTDAILNSGVERIVTADPHALNALKKDYTDLPPVEHISQTVVQKRRRRNNCKKDQCSKEQVFI